MAQLRHCSMIVDEDAVGIASEDLAGVVDVRSGGIDCGESAPVIGKTVRSAGDLKEISKHHAGAVDCIRRGYHGTGPVDLLKACAVENEPVFDAGGIEKRTRDVVSRAADPG